MSRRSISSAAAVALSLAVTGLSLTTVAQSTDIDGVFDVGGHGLYLKCEGTGTPTIVYLHGAIWDRAEVPLPHANGEFAQRALADDYRVCVYDRRNVGLSDSVDAPQLPEDAVGDLHGLLAAADVEPPYVLLGASFGGLLAYLYANEYPDDVVGMLLLDSMIPDELPLDQFFPPDDRFEAFDAEDESDSAERISHFKVLTAVQPTIGQEPAIPVTYLLSKSEGYGAESTGIAEYDAQILDLLHAFVDRFSPGRYVEVDSPHFMEAAILDQVVEELRGVIAAAAGSMDDIEASKADASSSIPAGVVAIGHSGLTGENSDPARPGAVALENSWATGTNAQVDSIYQRLLAVMPETEGRVSNQAQGGAPAQTLASQAELALREVPTPALTIIQTIDGDIRCDGTDDTHVAEFGQAVQAALDVITSASPETRILIVSQLGRPATEAMVLSGDATVQASLRGTGICDFYDPGGEYMPDRVAALTAIIEAYETEQARVCAEASQCSDDDGVLASDPRDGQFVSSDWGHLNIEGQGHVAELIWPVVSALLELPL